MLADPNFFKAFLNSVLWTLGSLAGQLIIGFTGALAINRVNFGKGIYRTLMIIPWAFPSIVIALSWKWILNGVSGFIPNILVQLGICNELPQFLSDNSFVFLTLIFINIWFGAPMIMVNVLSALQTIPQDQYEAAQIDGASKVQQFWYITVPHIKVVVGLLVVLRKKPPMWLHSIMKNEMKYLNGILHGKEVDEEFRPLLTGEAARAAIATADACTRSRFEDRKVKLSEIIG